MIYGFLALDKSHVQIVRFSCSILILNTGKARKA